MSLVRKLIKLRIFHGVGRVPYIRIKVGIQICVIRGAMREL